MSSPAIAIRNKENAQHSTGPRTPEGKLASSRNASKHGLTGQFVVLPSEDHAAYDQFRGVLLQDLKPEGTVETTLAQNLCDAQWRLERARKAEANILALVHYEEAPAHLAAIEDPAERQAMFEAYGWEKHERTLRNIQLHESRLQRTFSKTLAELQSLQALRKRERQQALDEAAEAKRFHQHHDLAFDPNAFGFVFTDGEIDRELKRRHVAHNPLRPFPDSRRQHSPTPTKLL